MSRDGATVNQIARQQPSAILLASYGGQSNLSEIVPLVM